MHEGPSLPNHIRAYIIAHFISLMNMRFVLPLQVDDIEMLRYDAMDGIGDCCRVIGGTICLSHFVRALEVQMQLFINLPVEAQVS